MLIYIDILLQIVALYLLVGFVFSILFLWKGTSKVDAGSLDTPIGFKLLLLPGMCVFWILFLMKWIKAKKS